MKVGPHFVPQILSASSDREGRVSALPWLQNLFLIKVEEGLPFASRDILTRLLGNLQRSSSGRDLAP